MIQKAEGDYDGALAQPGRSPPPVSRATASSLNQIGRILFLAAPLSPKRSPRFKDTLDVDPEDLQAHYNLMLCYRGLGQTEKAEREEKLFLRFKADESAQALTEKPRLLSPEENNERQPIHDHDALPAVVAARAATRCAGR